MQGSPEFNHILIKNSALLSCSTLDQRCLTSRSPFSSLPYEYFALNTDKNYFRVIVCISLFMWFVFICSSFWPLSCVRTFFSSQSKHKLLKRKKKDQMVVIFSSFFVALCGNGCDNFPFCIVSMQLTRE